MTGRMEFLKSLHAAVNKYDDPDVPGSESKAIDALKEVGLLTDSTDHTTRSKLVTAVFVSSKFSTSRNSTCYVMLTIEEALEAYSK